MTDLPEDIVSDAEVEAVHAHAQFGNTPKRRVVDGGVIAFAFGHHIGATQRAILMGHGLIRVRHGGSRGALSNKGKRYLKSLTACCNVDAVLTAMGR